MEELIERAIQINEELGAKLKELRDLEEPNLLGADGKYFTAEIKGIKCKGRIAVEDNYVYLCQNKLDGRRCKEKYGYNYSYFIEKGTETYLELVGITNLKLWDYLPKEGEYFYVKSRSGFSYIAIAKNGKDLTNRFVSLNQDNGRLSYDESGCVCSELDIKELRSATTQEIAFLDAKLKGNGQYFDQESMSIKDIVNEPTFKVGDWVLITKPKNVRQKPSWSYCMDKYDGQTLEIEEFNSDGYLVIDYWEFHPDWCTKVEVPKSETMVNGLKEYFKNTPKAQVVKDWEATREFDKTPKPNKPKVGDLCIFWNCDKINAVIGKLTEIDNKSDILYEVGSMWSYMHCIKFESMEQYLEFIKADTMDQATN